MLRLPFRHRALIAAVVAIATAWPAGLPAQVTRAFDLCFFSGVGSCSTFTLTATGGPGFTALEVEVRHAEGTDLPAAPRSLLGGFFFSYAPSVFGPDGGTGAFPPLLDAEGSAPSVLDPEAWTQRESAGGQAIRWVGFGATTADTFDDAGWLRTFGIGGCGVAAAGGALDAVFVTPLWTCGDGRYRFTTAVDGDFDLAQIRSIGVDTRATFAGEALGVDAFCTAIVDGTESFGTDGDTFGDVCRARDLSTTVVVPEPSGVPLVGTGLLGLLSMWSRRRARRSPA